MERSEGHDATDGVREVESQQESHRDSEETDSEDPEETESDGEPMENDVEEETMSDMGVQARDSTFSSLGKVQSQTEKLKKENLNPGEADSAMDYRGHGQQSGTSE